MIERSTIPASMDHGVDGTIVTVPPKKGPLDGTTVAKKIAKKMLQGYQVTSVKCTDCNVPLMSHRGIVRCVVCMDEMISLATGKKLSSSEEEEEIALLESRNEFSSGDAQRRWRVDESVINVTNDGIELSRFSFDVRDTRNTTRVSTPVQGCESDDIEHMLKLLDNDTDERSEDIWVSGSSNGRPSEHNETESNAPSEFYEEKENTSDYIVEMTNEESEDSISQRSVLSVYVQRPLEHEVNEVVSEEVHRVVAVEDASTDFTLEGQAGERKEVEESSNTRSRNALVLQFYNRVRQQQQQLAVQPAPRLEQASHHVEAAVETNVAAPTLISTKEDDHGEDKMSQEAVIVSSQCQLTHEVEEAHTSCESPNINVKPVNTHMVGVSDELIDPNACYAKGKAFATKIIQETDGILNDLVCTMSQVKRGGIDCATSASVSSSKIASIKESKIALITTSHEEASISKSTPGLGSLLFDYEIPSAGESNKKAPLIIPRPTINTLLKERSISPKNVASDAKASMPIDVKEEPSPAPAPPAVTASPELKEKRTTINNLAKDHSTGRQKYYMPAWENSMKNFVFNDDGSVAGYEKQQLTTSSDEVVVYKRDVFFEELRHRALMTKATQIHQNLEVSGFATKQNEIIPATPPQSDHDSISAMSFSSTKSISHHDHLSDMIGYPPPTTPGLYAVLEDSLLPDDEKKYEALQVMREETTVLPFDENSIMPQYESTQLSIIMSGTSSSSSAGSMKNDLTSVQSQKSTLTEEHRSSIQSKLAAAEQLLSTEEIALLLSPPTYGLKKNNPSSVQSQKSISSVQSGSSIVQSQKSSMSVRSRNDDSDVLSPPSNRNDSTSGSSVVKSQKSSKSIRVSSPLSNRNDPSSGSFVVQSQKSSMSIRSKRDDSAVLSPLSNRNDPSSGSSVVQSHKSTYSVHSKGSVRPTVLSPSSVGSNKNDPSPISFHGKAGKEELTAALKATLAKASQSSSNSIAEISSSFQLQQERIAQFEADALRKHREAELAAANAREALDEMVKARNDHKKKINKATAKLEPEEERESKCEGIVVKIDLDNTDKSEEKDILPNHVDAESTHGDMFSAASVSQYSHMKGVKSLEGSIRSHHGSIGSHQGSVGSHQSILTTQVDVTGNVDTKLDPPQCDDDIDANDGSVNLNNGMSKPLSPSSNYLCKLQDERLSTSSSYLSKLRETSEKRKQSVKQSGYHQDEVSSIERSESKISVADSVSSKSTLSTYDQFDEGPTQSKDHNINDMRTRDHLSTRHLLLPSLITSEPVGRKSSFESFATPRATPSSFHAAQQPSSRNHHRYQSKPSLKLVSESMKQTMKPNHLVPYSPRRGFVDATSPIEVLRPQIAPEYQSRGRSRSFVPRSPSLTPKSPYEQKRFGFHAYAKAPTSTTTMERIVSQNESVTRERDIDHETASREQKSDGNFQPRTRPCLLQLAHHPTKGVESPIMNKPQPSTRDLDALFLAQQQQQHRMMDVQPRTREVDPLQLAQHPTKGVESPIMNKPQPSTRDLDALFLAQQQHRMMDERMAYMNQPTTARVQRPSFDIHSRDFDALLLAQHQTIGEQLASRREQFMGASTLYSSGLHYPTMQTSQQHVPSNQTFGNSLFEQQSQLLSSGGGRQLYMTEGGHNIPISAAGYNLSMPSAQHAPPTLTFGSIPYQQFGGSVNVQQQSQAPRSVSFGNHHPFMSTSGVLVHPHSVGGLPQQQLWQYH